MTDTFESTDHISAAEVEIAIAEYMINKRKMQVNAIKFDIVSEICGMDRTPCANLKGATLQGHKNYTPPVNNCTGWEGEVDRQGGSFTQDEIDNATQWK